jgi:hypothetical protein
MIDSGTPPAVLDCSQFQIDLRGRTVHLAELLADSGSGTLVLPQNTRRLLVTGDIVPLHLLQADDGLLMAKAVASGTDTEHPRSYGVSCSILMCTPKLRMERTASTHLSRHSFS